MFDAVFVVMMMMMWTVCQADEGGEPKCDHIGYSPFTIRKEICGSDGQTYSNEKHLEFENCTYRRGEENRFDTMSHWHVLTTVGSLPVSYVHSFVTGKSKDSLLI
jgi:hypothetical protein